jgi:hypothetical protein
MAAREIEQAEWESFLTEFNEQNRRRPTRLGVIRMEDGVEEDFWIEGGLPLTGVGVELDGEDAPRVQIMLGGESSGEQNLTHTVRRVRRLCHGLSLRGMPDGLEFEADDGAKTFLRFES